MATTWAFESLPTYMYLVSIVPERSSALRPPIMPPANASSKCTPLSCDESSRTASRLTHNCQFFDRFAFSLEEIEPFTSEPYGSTLTTTNQSSVRRTRWDKQSGTSWRPHARHLRMPSVSMYASATVVVRKMEESGKCTNFR